MGATGRRADWRGRPAFVGAVLALALLSSRPSASDDSSKEKDRWGLMEGALRILWSGDDRMRRMFANSAYSFFEPLSHPPPGHDEQDVQAVVESLRSLIRTERDEWISTTLLKDLAIRHDGPLEPLFFDALTSPSPNLRWRAIRWFADHSSQGALQDLEYLWRHEDRPWVRLDLISALALHGSHESLDEFLRLARGKDDDLAEAAIDALGILKDERAVPILTGIAARGRQRLRPAAVEALASFPSSPEALEALLAATRSSQLGIQASAARALGSFASPGPVDRLADLAGPGIPTIVRGAALGSLAAVDPGRAIPLLMQALHEPILEGIASSHEDAIEALTTMDDSSVLEALADVDTSAEGFPTHRYEVLMTNLKRDRETEGRSFVFSTSCSWPTVITDPDDPRMRVVASPAWLLSIRCWEYPGGSGDPGHFKRVPTGTPVEVDDHFELHGESWVAMTTLQSQHCWVPLRFIEPPAAVGTSEAVDTEETMLIRREFDLPAGEVESDMAQGLMDAGLLEVIEPGDEVMGVAIMIDPEDFDRVLLLARSCGLNETMLDGEIYDIVSDLAPLHSGHPALERFRRAVEARPGETDEVFDLDIEELSDH